ncbi:MAG: Ig-like domain-containing protein, partial [Novosphingobium sp.]
MDYETRQDSDGELGNGQLGNGQLVSEIAAAAEAIGRTGGIPLIPDAQGQIVLPEGATLDDLQVRGRDLVIQLPDGRVYVIADGAVYVPEIVVGGVTVPPLNLAALLANPADPDNRPEPADIGLRSSGGNFAEQARPLQAARGLGDLLPYTEFGFQPQPDREVIPAFVDRPPTTIIITPDNPSGAVSATASVNEAGLPGPRLNGNPESPGSNAASNSETTTGSIVFTAPDGLASITLNGIAITAVNQTFTTPRGVLTITSIAPGNYGYSYTLTDNTSGDSTSDDFAVVVTDSDGDVASAMLRINIVDDVPTARNDTDTVPAATYTGESGNVITGIGTTSGSAGADTKGADDATLTGFRAGTSGAFAAPGTTINGTYGKLTFNAAGNYTYTRNAGTPGGVTDTFSYQLTDGDTDTSTATLVITITDSPATVTSVPTTGGATTVNESGLPARPGETEGSNAAAPSESASGTITFTAPDGVASVAINGTVITGPGQVIVTPTGTFTVTAFNPAGGTLSYTFTLTDNTSGDTTTQVLTVTVTDIDGDADTKPFTITIIDDTPTARNDAATQASENAAVTLNVITGAGTTTGAAGADTPGADGVNLTSGVAAVPGTLSGAGTLVYNNDGTFTYTPAPGEQGTVTFQYRITDGDGDTSTATVTITLLRDSTPTVEVVGDNTVDEAALPARPGEPAGSNAASSDETAVGTINIATGGDTLASLIIKGVNVTAGGTVPGLYGTLTVTLNAGVYSYSYTLNDNTLGDATTDPFSVQVTDSDGDVASTTLTIAIVDDKPTAVADTDTIASGTFGPATGNVITDAENDGGKDTQGADGVTVTAISGFNGAGTVGGTTAGQYGTLTLNADGSYSYTRTAGTKGGVSDVFTYTITDADGDTSSTTLTITIDDATPITGTNGAVLLDDDALAGGNPGGTGDDADAANTSGTLAGSGGDGPLTWAFQTTGFPAGFTYVANGTGIDVFQGATKVLTITLNTANGAYVVTQNAPIVHAAGSDENNQPFTLSYTVTDQDLDSAGGTLVINVDDDTPTATNDTNSLLAGATGPATGNVLTNDSPGADGQAVGGGVTAITGFNGPGAVGGSTVGQYGTLTLNANGSYSYTRSGTGPINATDTFTYTLTDKDGDSTTATLTITLQDAAPSTTPNAAVQLDDDALAGGNAGGIGDDANGVNTSGTLSGSGGDGAKTWAFLTTGFPAGFTYSLNGSSLEVFQG